MKHAMQMKSNHNKISNNSPKKNSSKASKIKRKLDSGPESKEAPKVKRTTLANVFASLLQDLPSIKTPGGAVHIINAGGRDRFNSYLNKLKKIKRFTPIVGNLTGNTIFNNNQVYLGPSECQWSLTLETMDDLEFNGNQSDAGNIEIALQGSTPKIYSGNTFLSGGTVRANNNRLKEFTLEKLKNTEIKNINEKLFSLYSDSFFMNITNHNQGDHKIKGFCDFENIIDKRNFILNEL